MKSAAGRMTTIIMVCTALSIPGALAAAHAQEAPANCGDGQHIYRVFNTTLVCASPEVASVLDELGWLVELVGQPSNATNNVWHPQTSDTKEGGWSSGGSLVLKSTDTLIALAAPSATVTGADSIGLAVGGAQDVNNFRANIKEGYLPLATDITPEGLFYDYLFETASVDCEDLFCPTYSKAISPDPFTGKVGDVWLSVGLDSGITGFERPDLNLVVVLDVSGSMSSALDTYHYDDPMARPDFGSMSKMEAANRAVAGLTDHLGPADQLGIVLFDGQPHLARPLLSMEGVDRDQLKANIMGIYPDGGTYMEGGMRMATDLFGVGAGLDDHYRCSSDGEWCIPAENRGGVVCTCPEGHWCTAEEAWCIDSIGDLSCKCTEGRDCPDEERWCITHMPDRRPIPDDGRANRIIFLTDAMPNIGDTSEHGLLSMVGRNAHAGIHTTFVGIGLDFNTGLVDAITKVRGANYYSVHSPAEFDQRMIKEFDFMVTPLVFGLELTLDSATWEIERVYGSPEADESTGTILRVNTLFPSAQVDNEVRGGIILLKMHSAECEATIMNAGPAPDAAGCLEPMGLRATYESVDGERFVSEESIMLSSVDDTSFEGAENNGIRKGVLLARFAELMQSWIDNERVAASEPHEDDPPHGTWERKSLPLMVSYPYDILIELFAEHFASEAAEIGDPDLSQEEAVLAGLIRAAGR